MNKELQDLAWALLPKEFKEEVKKMYCAPGPRAEEYNLLQRLFGVHNLTSDVEGEVELLHVTRQKVMGLYANAKKLHDLYTSATCINEAESRTIDHTDGTMRVLKNLFGSKCLPDNVDSSEPNVESLDANVESLDPKPAEPKYALSDKVMLNGYGGFEITAVYLDPYTQEYKYRLGGFKCHFCESDLEPYTEPDTSHETPVCENHSDDTSQKEANVNVSQNIVDCDKQLDNILKDSFRNVRRLNIAARIMSAILSNQMMLNNLAHGETTAEGVVRCVVDTTMMYTDALLVECKKGGSDGN